MIGVGTFRISENGKRYVNEVLTSERLSYGPYTQKFERVFAAEHASRFAIMTNSGTCCLLIALAALKNKYNWQDGDEVIVPAVTFIATSNIVIQLNMKPVFVDVDPTYYEIDTAKIEEKITARTRCIIPVHLFGLPCDMDPILAIAKKYNLRIIEDSCETMFTNYKGRPVGSFGDIGCFSTYVAHILTTGVGGLCTTNDPDLAINLRSLMNHGRDSIYLSIDDDNNKTKEELELITKRRFSFVQMGYSFRVTEMEGALGLAEFENREEMMQKRRDNGEFFIKNLSRWSEHIQVPTLRENAGHAFMMFPIVMKNESKAAIVQHLEENGIETRDMLPLTNQPFYQNTLGIKESDYPVAKWINDNGFYIGCHQGMSVAERNYILEIFENFFLQKEIRKEESCLVLLSKGNGRVGMDLYDLIPTHLFQEKILIEASRDTKLPDFYKKKGFKVIQEQSGKGKLLKDAVRGAKSENIVVLGLDGSDDPRDINLLLIHLKQGNDLVVASRFMPGGERYSSRVLSYRSLGNRFFSFLISILFSKNITDPNNSFRAFKKSTFEALRLRDNDENIMFESTVKAVSNNLKFFECPTREKPAMVTKYKRNRFLQAVMLVWILGKQVISNSKAIRKRESIYDSN